jgi:hypothetical protein
MFAKVANYAPDGVQPLIRVYAGIRCQGKSHKAAATRILKVTGVPGVGGEVFHFAETGPLEVVAQVAISERILLPQTGNLIFDGWFSCKHCQRLAKRLPHLFFEI